MSYMVAQPVSRHTDETTSEAAFRRQVQVIKSGVCISHVASEYGSFKPASSDRLIGRCVSPDHEDKTPSLMIYRQDQRFHCFGCQARGDVLDFVRLADPSMEVWEVMMELSTRYGIELPTRPQSWFDRQARQAPMRELADEERIRHISKLVFRLLFVPWLRRLPPDDIEADTESARQASRRIAQMVYASRREA